MSANSFIKIFFFSCFTLLMSISSFNFFMDPNWTFSHSHRFNNVQEAPNERIQKSSQIYFKNDKYDALLLGSSRVTFFNQFNFKNDKVYNYAFSLAMPYEYAPYIEFAKKHNSETIKKIYIGMDFLGSNKNFKNDVVSKEVFDDIQSCCYKYKLLFSIDSLKISLFSLKASITKRFGFRSYKRNNVAMSMPRSKESVKKDVENKKLEHYVGNIKEYQFDPSLKDILLDLKQKNPDIEFVFFTTPTSRVYLQKLFDLGYKEDYKKWLHLLVDVNSEIYHFMDFNSVNNNYEDYYMDYHHLYPNYAGWIIDRLEHRKNPDIPEDFGVILNSDNIDKILNKI